MGELISIIVPVYNVADYIEHCILSILRQTYSNLEILLVDDGSTDGSSELCDKYQQIDSRIKVIHNRHEGLVKTRKIGAEQSSGKFITIVDGDDWIDVGTCEHMLKLIHDSQADVVDVGYKKEYGNYYEITQKSIIPGIYDRKDFDSCLFPLLWNQADVHGVVHTIWGKLYRRDVYIWCQNLVDDRVGIGEDLMYFYALLLKIDKYAMSDICLYHYRQRKTSMVHDIDDSVIENVNYLYENIKQIEKSLGVNNILYRKIRRYLYEFAVQYAGQILETKATRMYMVPWHLIPSGAKLALYGAGSVGKAFYAQLMCSDYCSLGIWVDKNDEMYKKKGFRVEPVKQLERTECDVILIAVKDRKMKDQIVKELELLRLGKKRLIWEPPKIVGHAYFMDI